MILQQNFTLVERPVMTIGFTGPAVDDLGPVDSFAVRIGTGVKWVLQQRNDVPIADWRPIERRHSLAIRRARKVHALGLERQVHLAGTAQFAEALENSARDFLDATIRIETQPDLPMPDIADRYRDPEFSPTGFRPRGVEHPRSQNAEFELADAALHT